MKILRVRKQSLLASGFNGLGDLPHGLFMDVIFEVSKVSDDLLVPRKGIVTDRADEMKKMEREMQLMNRENDKEKHDMRRSHERKQDHLIVSSSRVVSKSSR